MKKKSGLFLLALFLFLTAFLNAMESEHYRIIVSVPDGGAANIPANADTEAAIQDLALELESRFEIYNRFFRFDPSLLRSLLNVRVFEDKSAYDMYVSERLGDAKPGAIYLHYSQSERCELVIQLGNSGETAMLAHQAFIQYLRGFIANPPSWLREGFAIYYSALSFDPRLREGIQRKAAWKESYVWLESAKNLGRALPAPAALMGADLPDSAVSTGGNSGIHIDVSSADFQISSWALVSFLLNGRADYFRTLTDGIARLSPSAGAVENSEVFIKLFSFWNGLDAMDIDFRNYLGSQKTFRELMQEGQSAYSRGGYTAAKASFMAAGELRPSDYAPCYYLGMIAYEEKDYAMAERYYLAGLERGADEALINYALGVNASAAGRFPEAAVYLRKAASQDPARYRTQAEDIIRKIGQ